MVTSAWLMPAASISGRPRLALDATVENARLYAESRAPVFAGRIEVGGRTRGAGPTAGVELWVDNPGPYAGPREGGEGIASVTQRLAVAYDGAASLVVEGRGDRTRATMILPGAQPLEDA